MSRDIIAICITLLAACGERRPPAPGWPQLLRSGDYDAATAVATDADGNVLVTGFTTGVLERRRSAGDADVFVAKYAPDGVRLWIRQLGSPSNDVAVGIATDADGNVLVAGFTGGAIDGQTPLGNSDGFVVKYDPLGTKLWTRLLGTPSIDYVWSVVTDPAGNVLVAGSTLGDLGGNGGRGDFDLFVVKYDPEGASLWTMQDGTAEWDEANGVATDANGDVFVAGTSGGGLDGNASAGATDPFVAKYDSGGAKLWTRQLGSSSVNLVAGVATDRDGAVLVTGGTEGALAGDVPAGEMDAFVVKYAGDGTKQWARQIGSWASDYGEGVATTADGGVYVSGSTLGGLDGPVHGPADVFLVCWDASGERRWTAGFATPWSDMGSAVATDASANAFVAGTTGEAAFITSYDAAGRKR